MKIARRWLLSAGFLLCCVVALVRAAPAQSLGDIARQQRTEKKEPATRVITNEDLARLGGTINVVGAEPAPPADTAGPEAAPGDATPKPKDKARPQARAAGFRYTVRWAAIPDVMGPAVFRFTMPAVATKNGTVPAKDVEIVSNPCTAGQPADPAPQLYATTALHIYLNCAGVTKKGAGAVGLARLVGELARADGKEPGHYSFKAALNYYVYGGAGTAAAGGSTELSYATSGTLEIEPVSAEPVSAP